MLDQRLFEDLPIVSSGRLYVDEDGDFRLHLVDVRLYITIRTADGSPTPEKGDVRWSPGKMPHPSWKDVESADEARKVLRVAADILNRYLDEVDNFC